MLNDAFNHIEPPWYGPVCLVVWEGGNREGPPYPDFRSLLGPEPAVLCNKLVRTTTKPKSQGKQTHQIHKTTGDNLWKESPT